MEKNVFLRCRWLLSPGQPPRENACLVIHRGRIADITFSADSRAHDLGDAIVIPPLVNVHTHLEFSNCVAPLEPATPFPDWLAAVVGFRRSQEEPIEQIIRRGIEESRAAGVSILGEIATTTVSADVCRSSRVRGVVFRELIGLSEDAIEDNLSIAREHLSGLSGLGGQLRHGLSPHAPYSVHPDLFAGLLALAGESSAAVAMHLAETRDEKLLLEQGCGGLRSFLERLGVWNPGAFSQSRSIHDLVTDLADVPRALIVHGNYLEGRSLKLMAEHSGMTLVVCPRTHRYFQHPEHPWPRLLEAGGRVAVGTDSRASNPDLSLWQEIRSLHRVVPQISFDQLLTMATLSGAEALGMDDGTGRLEVGGPAELVIVRSTREISSPVNSMLEDRLSFQAWSPPRVTRD